MSLILKSKALLFSVIGGVAAVAAGIIIAVTSLFIAVLGAASLCQGGSP